MRALLSIVGLLVVVAIVLMLSANQLNALGYGIAAMKVADSEISAKSNAPGTPPDQARSIEQKARADLQGALDAGTQLRASEPGP